MLNILDINPVYTNINKYLDNNNQQRLAQSHPVLWQQGKYILRLRIWHDQISPKVLKEINDIARRRKVTLNLSHLRDVNVSMLTNLYELDLSCCWGVMGIDMLNNLHKLDLSYCEDVHNLASVVNMKGLIRPFDGKSQADRMESDIDMNVEYNEGTRKGVLWSINLHRQLRFWCGYIHISEFTKKMRDNIERYTHNGITHEIINAIGFGCWHKGDYSFVYADGIYRSFDYVQRKLFAMIDYYVAHN